MKKHQKQTLNYLFIFSILCIGFTIFSLSSLIGKSLSHSHNELILTRYNKLNICRQQHKSEILDFTLQCIQSLQVEENSKISLDCEKIALRNICY